MKKYHYTFPLLLGFLLSSCELTKVVKPKLKEDAPKIMKRIGAEWRKMKK
jgi:hypothetical protein